MMALRSCRICGEKLETFYYRCDDTGDMMYSCLCGAINTLKRPTTKAVVKFVNEWTSPGTVTLEQAPIRETCGGYHTPHGVKQKKKDNSVRYPEALEEVEMVEGMVG